MSSIKLTATSGGGTFEIKAPSSGSNPRILNVPDENGTLLTSATSTGKVLQIVHLNKTDASSMSMTETFTDVTGFSLSITPTAANSKIILQGVINYACEDHYSYGKFVRSINGGSYADVTGWIGDADGNRIRSMTGNPEAFSTYDQVNIPIYAVDDSHNTTDAITYKLQFRGSFNHLSIVGYFNRSETDANSNNGSRAVSNLTLMEVAA
tara:strand:- start:127 stop:753 length:627 start_codon:yes stop_codon:yes gene_type:complete